MYEEKIYMIQENNLYNPGKSMIQKNISDLGKIYVLQEKKICVIQKSNI